MLAWLLLLQLGDDDQPHRHVPTRSFPVPEWVADPELRKMLKEEFLREGPGSLFNDPKDREEFLRWMREYLQNQKGSSDSQKMARDLANRNPELLKRLNGANFRDLLHRISKRTEGHSSFFRDPPGDRGALSAFGTDMMQKLLGKQDLSVDLSKDLEGHLRRFEKWVEGIDSTDIAPSRGGSSRSSGGSSGPSSGSGSGPSVSLPLREAFNDVAVRPSARLVWIVVIAIAAAMAGYVGFVLYARVRGGAGGASGPEVFTLRGLRPVRSREEFLEAYRIVMRFALQRRLLGLSHVEVEREAAERFPAARERIREMTESFEHLYYDLVRLGDPALLEEAARRFPDLVEALRVAPPR